MPMSVVLLEDTGDNELNMLSKQV